MVTDLERVGGHAGYLMTALVRFSFVQPPTISTSSAQSSAVGRSVTVARGDRFVGVLVGFLKASSSRIMVSLPTAIETEIDSPCAIAARTRGRVDLPLMRERYWKDTEDDPDRERRRQVEFLVHDRVPWEVIEKIGVMDAKIRARVEGSSQGRRACTGNRQGGLVL